MKVKILTAVFISTMVTSTAFAVDTPKTAPAAVPAPAIHLTTDEAKLSYIFGLNIGMNLRMQHVTVDPNIFLKGLNDGLTGTAPSMTQAQIQAALTQFQQQMMAKQKATFEAASAKNLKDGVDYMKANAAKPGVKTLAEGQIQYLVKTEGKGPIPKATDTVSLTYEGKLVNGKVFDTTDRNGNNQPVSMPISHMIPGMQQVLLTMPVGSTWDVAIAPKLAYGPQGIPMSLVGPNETLLFQMTLKGITPGIAPVVASTPK